MKRIYQILASVLIVSVLLSVSTCKQNVTPEENFEGVIHYKHSLESKNTEFPFEYLFMMYDTVSDYYFKEGKYRWIHYKSFFNEDLYLPDSNKNYFLTADADHVYFTSGEEQLETVLEHKIENNVQKIIGFNTNRLTIKAESIDGIITTRHIYYTPELKIDGSWFSKLKLFNYDFIYSITNSPLLKIVLDTENFKITWEAYNVEPKKLEDNLFYIGGMEDAQPVSR